MSINSEQYFSTVPNINCPRSYFDRSFSYKFTMNTDYLYPFFIDEALPGDSFKVNFQVFGRLENPLLRPVMDELYFETLWFKIPNRLVWSHWVNFCGEQDNPDDSTDYLLPVVTIDGLNVADNLKWSTQGIFDIFGIPRCPAIDSELGDSYYPSNTVNSLPLRAYNLVYNQWFRDENLQDSVTVPMGDDDSASNYTLLKSNKSHDYFTSCLPFAQKGEPVQIPFIINGSGLKDDGKLMFNAHYNDIVPQDYPMSLFVNKYVRNVVANSTPASTGSKLGVVSSISSSDLPVGFPSSDLDLHYKSGLSIDTGAFQGINVNDFRFAMALQTKRERDARGGTRYIEWIKSQFDVDSPDARLQRSEFLGSTRSMIDINAVVQTSSTDSTSAQGNLTAYGLLNNFQSVVSTSFVEHSYLLGLCRIRHNPVYQQGISRLWKRKELLDFYIPAFIGLGEQPVFNYEIYCQGDEVVDDNGDLIDDKAFGFQPAWSDYRYALNRVGGYMRSNVSNSLDIYHFAEDFSELPLLNSSFIQSNVPLDSRLALPTEQNDLPQFVMDVRFFVECARPMPVVDIPAGLHNHF